MQEIFLFRGIPSALKGLELPAESRYEKGEIIYERDHYEKALGVLLTGKAEAVAQERSALRSFGSGDVFGAAALFGGGEYVSMIRATAPCRVQYIPEDVLRQRVAEYPQTALNYIGFLSEKIRFLNE